MCGKGLKEEDQRVHFKPMYLLCLEQFSDHDLRGFDVFHNDKIFSVFESIGGKINWMFIKDEFGNSKSVIGSDMAYWSETDGDYNEESNNHFAGLSDVYPNNQNNGEYRISY